MEPDYYKVLGVAPSSEDVVIQAAYRALMRRYHPDTNPSAEAARKTIEINAAYAVLRDPAKRAAYDARRTESSAPPPPPPESPNDGRTPAQAHPETDSRRYGGLIFASVLTASIIGAAIFTGVSSTNSSALNVMNVDENLTTTDMTATDMNMDANMSMNATDMNVVEATPSDLSKQPATALSYSLIEDEAKRVAKLIVTQGVSGARSYSERCHKAVENSPTWTGADSCAAFDYAAAHVDAAVSNQAGWPKSGYFEFQSSNQSDVYASVGAPTYMTSDRLTKIRSAAQDAALEAFKVEVARLEANKTRAKPADDFPAEAPIPLGNSAQ